MIVRSPGYTQRMVMINHARLRLPLRALLALTACVCCLGGCKSEEQLAEEAQWRMDTPLPHDPMDKDVVGPWWGNGDDLLNLRADSSYLLYAHNNRYGRPVQRGRWAQHSYAVITLEPYSRLEREPTRVGITKIDGVLTLMVPDMPPLTALEDGPPVTREDVLIGEWQGTMGRLRLNSDSTYSFVPAPGSLSASGAAMIAGHNGRWSLRENRLHIAPDTPSIAPLSLEVRESESPSSDETPVAEPTLEGLGGVLTKVKSAEA